MADWAKEILKLGNDFCLNTSKVLFLILIHYQYQKANANQNGSTTEHIQR